MSIDISAKDARRTEILRAALAVFLERGVEDASINEIRRRSGASTGSLYHRFGSKQGIAAALYLDALADYQQHFLTALTAAAHAERGIKAGVAAHLQWVQENTDLARYLFMDRDAEVRTVSREALHRLNRRFLEAVTAWLTPHIDSGHIRPLSYELLSALWLGPSQEISRHILTRRTTVLDPYLSTLADAAWTSLRVPSASARVGQTQQQAD